MRKINRRSRVTLVALCALVTFDANAQSSLVDYKEGKVDLGMGIEQNKLLSTAATETISGEELQKTSAISLNRSIMHCSSCDIPPSILLSLTCISPRFL